MIVQTVQRQVAFGLEHDAGPARIQDGAEVRRAVVQGVEEDAIGIEGLGQLGQRVQVGLVFAAGSGVPRVVGNEDLDPAVVEGLAQSAQGGQAAG